MPKSGVDTQRAIESIVRLRHAARHGDGQTSHEIEPVLSFLEDVAGPTVKRAEAARLLGISHTALDSWIDKGDIPAVLTPSGRREIPLSEVVDLLEELEEGAEGRPLTLAQLIRKRRRRAAAIPEEEFLPPRRRRKRTHDVPDLHALAYHRLVARRLNRQLVEDARKRLRQWNESGRIDARWARAWEEILAMPHGRIARAISADSERGRALRQTSPLVSSADTNA